MDLIIRALLLICTFTIILLIVFRPRHKLNFNKTNVFFGGFIAVLILIILLDINANKNDHFDWWDILVEGHGLLFDLLIFGLLLTYYDNVVGKRREIKKLKTEIMYSRLWGEAEAKYRITIAWLQLYELRELPLDLSECYLTSVVNNEFHDKKMKDFKFHHSNLTFSEFNLCSLINVDFSEAILIDTFFYKCNLSNSYFASSIILGTKFWECNLAGMFLEGAYTLDSDFFQTISSKNEGADELKKIYDLRAEKFDTNFYSDNPAFIKFFHIDKKYQNIICYKFVLKDEAHPELTDEIITFKE